MMDRLIPFLSGAVAFGYLTCGLFFLRFHRSTRDSMFLSFALAFLLLATGQAIISIGQIPTEQRAPVYLFRLAAYGLIIVAVVRKNRSARSS